MDLLPAYKQAVLAGDLETVEALLTARFDPNTRVGAKRDPTHINGDYVSTAFAALHVAAHADDAGLCALLLRFGADVLDGHADGGSPLHIAAKRACLRVLPLLLAAYPRTPPRRGTYVDPLAIATAAGHVEVTRQMLASGIAFELEPALLNACNRNGTPEVVELLLEAGADPTYRQRSSAGPPRSVAATARVIAFGARQFASLELFRGRPTGGLTDAAIDGDVAEVQAWLAHPSEPAHPDETDLYGQISPLGCAAARGHAEVIDALLAAGAQPNLIAFPRNSALISALTYGQLVCADRLWAGGARQDKLLDRTISSRSPVASVVWVLRHATDNDLESALHVAIRFAQLELAAHLIAAGADVRTTRFGETYLMRACHQRSEAAVKLLLDAGCDVHATDGQGRTALHYAISYEDIHDPDFPFDYQPAALDTPIARTLRQAGLAIPPRGESDAN